MPIATPEIYAQMLDTAKQRGFAFPAINCTSSQTLNAALRGFADACSDGIIQISTGGAEYLSGAVKEMVTGAVALADFAYVVAAKYPIHVALHTDHCPKDKLDGYMRPLVALSKERVARGEEPLFQSHMWDGSAVPLKENLEIAAELLAECAAAHIVMEMEIGVVGGEEDGIVGEINEKLYTTPEDALATAEAVGLGERGRYLLAATFGNVHGVYKPGHVKLRPPVLKEIQEAVGQKYGKDKPFDLVFHGGSGSSLEEIREGISYGVVKMNVDTDTQYSFTRPIAGHMFKNYDVSSRWTARSAARRCMTRAAGARPARGAWPSGSRTPARTCCRPATASAEPRTRTGQDRLPRTRTEPRTRTYGTSEPARRPAGDLPARRRGGGGRPAGGRAGGEGRGALPLVPGGLGRSGRRRVQARRCRHRLRVRADGLPPRPGPAAPCGLEGPRPGPVEHEPNRGFLRSLHMLAASAAAIGEDDEAKRCEQFLRDSSPTAAAELGTEA